MKKQLLIIIFLMSGICLQAATYYIDPTYSGTHTGTISQPLNTLSSVSSNTTYLFKGGTTFHANNNIGGTVDNCTIATYGTGKATILFNTSVSGRLVNLLGQNNTIQNLNVFTNNHYGSVNGNVDPNACTCVELYITGGRGTLKNIATKGGWRGIVGGHYGYYTGTMIIDSCSVDTIQSDGFYVTYLDSLIVHKAKSTNCNINWANDYGGDSFQEGNTLHIIFDSCYLDHYAYPGKYSLICNDYYEAQITNCYFRSYNGEGCMYPSSSDSSYFTATNITNCVFDGGMRGIENRSDNTVITNCLFKANPVTRFAIDAVVKLSCTNCTFVGYRDTIISTFGTSGVHYSTLNNNIFYNSGSIVGNLGNAIGSNNDFYNTPQNSNFSLTGTITTKPLFTDTIYYQNINLSGIGSNLHLNLLGTSNPVTPVIIITPNCAQSLKSARDSIKVLSTAISSESLTINLYKDSVSALKKSLVTANSNYNTLNSTYLALKTADNTNLSTISANILQISNLNSQITALNKSALTYTANIKVKNDSLNLARQKINNYNNSVNNLANFK